MTNYFTNYPYFSFKINILYVYLVGFLLALTSTAWVCDDAFITFRVIDNFINGYGLRWNVAERVQAYTNPLWMFLLSGFYFFTREIYFTSLIVSIVLSFLSVYLVAFKLDQSWFSASLAVIILISSKAFLHYSTAGLENPLTHLLIVLFFLVYLKIYLNEEVHKQKTLFLLALIAGLAIFNRMDNSLILVPTLVWVLWENRSWKTITWMLVGFIPFIAWELFSLVYYGFFFPNTAYAKLTTISHYKFVLQGLVYLVESAFRDPITLFTIAVAFWVPIWTKQRTLWPITLGILLTVIYVINVGGDFMSGRFLSMPLLGAVIVLSQLPFGKNAQINWLKLRLTLLIIIFSTLSLVDYLSPIRWIEKPYEFWRERIFAKHSEHFIYVPRPQEARIIQLGQKKRPVIFNISDERAIYRPFTELWEIKNVLKHPWAAEGQFFRDNPEKVIIRGAVGFLGFYAGPETYIIDHFGLSDALLARLPPHRVWRVGHLERVLPQGYFESIKQGKNLLVDKKMAHLYEQLQLVTRGELFDANRWRAIWQLNFGR